MSLTPRLFVVASMVDKGAVVADIGTDHAYLPVYLIQNGICKKAFACDIKSSPLEKGRQNIIFNHLEDKIETRLSDGLAGIDSNEADTFTIAGMGADVIIHILSSCPYIRNKKYTIIIQPMSKYYILTKWLFENGFSIEKQQCVTEGQRHYTVIKIRYSGEDIIFSPTDIYTGKMDLQDKECRTFLEMEIAKAEKRALGDNTLIPVIDNLKKILQQYKTG
ncbi:MAG: SAM-dependent methyltransferase [Oscillospiraceae bacterium]|nr:SAM-dependent methyltransferase [Oscillospiraceae bacterium]